jgi:hypothetical protein
MPTHYRDKTTHCNKCHSNCVITANLDKGTVIRGKMPTQCKTPRWCLDEFSKGIFDRQFGAPLIVKLNH